MTVRNLALDANGELVLSKGNLTLVSDGPAIQQAIQTQLRTFLGEWFLDDPVTPKIGVPYFQSVLVKNPNVGLLRKTFNDAILAVKGVKSVTELDLRYVSSTRSLTVVWRATTDSGLLISGQTGTP
jgi:hypothetical protein